MYQYVKMMNLNHHSPTNLFIWNDFGIERRREIDYLEIKNNWEWIGVNLCIRNLNRQRIMKQGSKCPTFFYSGRLHPSHPFDDPVDATSRLTLIWQHTCSGVISYGDKEETSGHPMIETYYTHYGERERVRFKP